jgi:D-threo-aldose 1-dehydrogenase
MARSLPLSRLGIGGGSLINATGEAGVRAILDTAWEAGLRYFDTAALYADGDSERRFGAALRHRPRHEFILSTKIGRFATGFDYTAAGTEAAIAASLARLGMDRLNIALIHDVIPALHGDAFEARFAEAMTGAYPVLHRLRAEGRIDAIGIALRDPDVALRFLKAGDFDCLMLAGGWTLLQRDAGAALLPHCAAQGVTVMAAAPFNTGILATGAVPDARYNYAPAPPAIMARVAAIETLCARHDLPLAAAALQFPLRHPAVASVVVGHQTSREVLANLALIDRAIPEAFWEELDGMAA